MGGEEDGMYADLPQLSRLVRFFGETKETWGSSPLYFLHLKSMETGDNEFVICFHLLLLGVLGEFPIPPL